MTLRILQITNMYPSPEKPAWGSFVKSQVDSIAAKGIETDVMVIDGYKSKFNYLRALRWLWSHLRVQRYDLIHAHYGLCGLIARMQSRVPVVVSFCGSDLYGKSDTRGRPKPLSLIWVFLHKLLARYIGGVIVKSPAMADLIPTIKAHVIPNGVELDVFREMDKDEVRRQLGLPLERILVLFPYSPNNARKNFPAVKATVELLKARHHLDIDIIVVDNAPHHQIPLYLNAADVVILVSYWEGSPNIMKEAMACGTRIVACDVGDVVEWIGDLPGCALTSREPSDIADAVWAVLQQPFKTPGRARIEAALSSERIAERVIKIYTDILGAPVESAPDHPAGGVKTVVRLAAPQGPHQD